MSERYAVEICELLRCGLWSKPLDISMTLNHKLVIGMVCKATLCCNDPVCLLLVRQGTECRYYTNRTHPSLKSYEHSLIINMLLDSARYEYRPVL